MPKHFTAIQLIDHAKAFIAADAARMSARPAGYPRAAWREIHPVTVPCSWAVRDTDYVTRPARRLSLDLNGQANDLWVWSTGTRPTVIERINLRAADADERLSRYEIA